MASILFKLLQEQTHPSFLFLKRSISRKKYSFSLVSDAFIFGKYTIEKIMFISKIVIRVDLGILAGYFQTLNSELKIKMIFCECTLAMI